MPHTHLTEEEFLRDIEKHMEKRFAPSGAVGALLPFTLIRCSAKEASLEVAYVPEPWVRNMNGTIHGGILMTLFDSAMGTLVKCFTGEMSTPTLNLSVNFSSPGYLSNTLRFAVHIEHCGAHSVQLQGRCYPENDPERTVATAQGVFFRA